MDADITGDIFYANKQKLHYRLKIISAHGFGTINVKEAVKCTGGSVRWMKSPTSYGCIVRAEVILPVSAKLSDDAN
jgi:hypothetical protein